MQHVDYDNSTVCGYLKIQGLTDVGLFVPVHDNVIDIVGVIQNDILFINPLFHIVTDHNVITNVCSIILEIY